VQDDLVLVRPESQAPRETLDRALEVAIVKRDQLPALVAQQVVMVIPRGVDDLVPSDPVTHLEPAHKTVLL
jgi:hypothetical protein